MNEDLLSEISDEEIRSVFHIRPSSAPRPDSMSGFFSISFGIKLVIKLPMKSRNFSGHARLQGIETSPIYV